MSDEFGDFIGFLTNQKETAVTPDPQPEQTPLERAKELRLKHANHNQASHGFRFGKTPSLEQARRYRKAGVLQDYTKRARDRSGTKPAKERNAGKVTYDPRKDPDPEPLREPKIEKTGAGWYVSTTDGAVAGRSFSSSGEAKRFYDKERGKYDERERVLQAKIEKMKNPKEFIKRMDELLREGDIDRDYYDLLTRGIE